MRNLADVLRQKEAELERLEREVDALKLAARLCSDEDDHESLRAEPVVTSKPIRGVSLDEPHKAMKQFP